MSRSADYTIKGFLYQFYKTILEILTNPLDTEITVEGIIEDIDIASSSMTTAVQCKYHEAKDKYSPSAIYKPVLQMMNHYKDNQTKNITYVLFSHFPDRNETNPVIITKTDLDAALASTNKDLKSLIATAEGVNTDNFLKRFRSEPGPSFDELANKVSKQLAAAGFDPNDVEVLVLPNAITVVADLSIKHLPSERKITGREFLEYIRRIRRTTISRWTLAMKSKSKILEARRKQLKTSLDQNQRQRYIFIDAEAISEFSDHIVIFVDDFLKKYHFKPAHTNTPLLCLSVDVEGLNKLQLRLYEKKVIVADGRIAGQVFEERLFREALSRSEKGGIVRREFDIRMVLWDDLRKMISRHKPDDIYVFGNVDLSSIDLGDVNIERLEVESAKEARYLMGVSDVIE